MARWNQVGKHKTTVAGDGDALSVVLHGTEVVRVRKGNVTLNSGGWRTPTTKVRMNQAANQYGLGFQVYQDDFAWFVKLPDGSTVEFYDNITFPSR